MRRLGEIGGRRPRIAKPPVPGAHPLKKPSAPPEPDACELEMGLLGRARVCHLIGACDRALERMIDSLEFPAPDRIVGRSHRWHPQTVREWLSARPRTARKGK